MSRRPLKLAALIITAGIAVAGTLVGYQHFARASEPLIPGVRVFTGLARTHTTGPVTYAQNPPVGGPHNPVPLNCGIYLQPVPNVHAVHSLEHGAVWITYRPGLPAAQVTALRATVRGLSYLLLSPYPGLPAPVVASAWGRQLRLGTADDPRLLRFISAYRAGPQAPERGAPCTGIGHPRWPAPP